MNEEQRKADEEKKKNAAFKEAFNVFDKDLDGYITTEELATVMRTLGYNPNQEELDEIIETYDHDKSGTIDYTEFKDLMNSKFKEQQEGKDLLEIFLIFDKDADGLISAEDMKYVANFVEVNLDDNLIKELIEQVDSDKDGRISYHEFFAIMTAKIN